MSLNMYLAETDSQTSSSNTIHIEIIQSMEQVMDAIDSFAGATLLQGKTYNTAKTYMSAVFRPLAQGIIDLSEELIRQNSNYPNDFRSQVATTDVIEDKVRMQIEKINDLIDKVEPVNDTLPVLNPIISIYQDMKRTLERKLEHLYEFNTATSDNYDLALELADNVLEGLNQAHNNNGFNSKDGTFSTEKMDLDWISKLNESQSMIKARDKFPDYYEENKDFVEKDDDEKKANMEKLIEVIEYDENNPDRAKDTDEFLTPLEEQDVVEIKYLMYTAEEPYRSLAMDYLDRFEIISTTKNGRFYSSDDAMRFNVREDRKNERGAYFTFFHELGHAIDYYYGKDKAEEHFFSTIGHGFQDFFGTAPYYSEQFETNENTLAEYMHEDVENRIRIEFNDKVTELGYDNLSSEEKEIMINNISEAMIFKDSSYTFLSEEEEEIYEEIQNKLSTELRPDQHNNASDVYGGVTLNEVVGKWGHHKPSYWMTIFGNRKREPDKEGFASYYGSIMIEDGELRNQELKSNEEYLPHSKKHMDKMFESMIKGGKE